MSRRAVRYPAVMLLMFALCGTAIAAEKSFEKTVPVPSDRDAKLDWTHEDCVVESVTLRNFPDEGEIEEARTKDRNDKSWLWWEFNVSNRGDRDCRVWLSVEVLDAKGRVLKGSDRSGSVSAGELDDDIRVSTLMKTIDAADAPKVRLRARIGPK